MRTALPKIIAMLIVLTLVSVGLEITSGSDPERGILNKSAPTWAVSQWKNLPPDHTSLDVKEYKGKVLYLYCFQSWCPGCHSHGFPTLQTLVKQYEKSDDVEFVAIQTVFEGFGTNTPEKAWQTAAKYSLKIPVGHDGSKVARSQLMSRYRTGGTPWTVIIDKNGVVRFNDFHITVKEAAELIGKLQKESVTS